MSKPDPAAPARARPAAAPPRLSVPWPTGAKQFDGRAVLVCGAGVAGEPAARALLALGARVAVVDSTRTPAIDALVAAGATFAGALNELPAGIDIVVTSPGWRPDNPLLASAAAAGIPVYGEVELAWRLRGADGTPGAPWLAVTGTNGKTTTVHMLEAILTAAGYRAIAVGNVGVSLIEAVMAGSGEQGYDVLAVELSSFQLHWSSTIVPAAGAILNLAPDHLDWHGSMEAYAAAKERVFRAPVAIGWDADAQVAGMLSRASGLQVAVRLGPPDEGELGVRDGQLIDRAFDRLPSERVAAAEIPMDGAALARTSEVRPAGEHNVVNALTAAALARAFGVPPDAVARGLTSFTPDRHRNEHVLDLPVPGGVVRVVDDSKATNSHAAKASLLAYERIVWVAGGQLKGAPVDDLVAQIADRLVGAVVLGADRAQITAALSRHAPELPVIEVASNDDGVMIEVARSALRLAGPGDTVLLAPAAASLDMFASYAARGDAFIAGVRAVAGQA